MKKIYHTAVALLLQPALASDKSLREEPLPIPFEGNAAENTIHTCKNAIHTSLGLSIRTIK